MRLFHWVIIVMDITLMLLLWLYIYNLYIQNRLNGLEYTSQFFRSDEAIPIIGLGVLLNTAALIYIVYDARRSRQLEAERKERAVLHGHLEEVEEQEEIKALEEELEKIVARLEELRKTARKE